MKSFGNRQSDTNQILFIVLHWGVIFLQIYVQRTLLFDVNLTKNILLFWLEDLPFQITNGYTSITIKKMSFDITNTRWWTIVVLS